MRIIFFIITVIINATLILFFNGNINIPDNPLPPLGKFLNPFDGAWVSNTSNEKNDFTIVKKALHGPVDVVYDERRVPHIFASDLDDLLYIQGYVEASNRLFQMDFLARVAAGELSEIFGERTIDLDLKQRRRGMGYAAENTVDGWKKQKNYALLERYVRGINDYISSLSPEDYPLEYKLFNIKPQKWSTEKTALIFKQMSLTLAGHDDDVEFTNLMHFIGAEDFSFLYPERQSVENPVINFDKPYKIDTLYGNPKDSLDLFKGAILNDFFSNRQKGIGSNSWAVSGSKTASGNPIFCNDPHLNLGLPSIWFEQQLTTPEFNAYGVSFPGLPGIMIGFNEHIAWGETNVSQDVEDIFKIEWTDPKRSKYRLDGTEETPTIRIERIAIKGQKPLTDTVYYTAFGPVYRQSSDSKHDLAMRWLAHDEPRGADFMTFIDAMSCKNYTDYLQATEPFDTPAQNFGFASKDGDIAMRVNGKFPAKFDQDGRFVEMGTKRSNKWQSFYPKYQNPQSLNPARGFVSSANQVSTDKTFPYYFNGKFEHYRNKSINMALDSMKKMSANDMKKLQLSAYSHKAVDALAVLLPILQADKLTASEKPYRDSLQSWDRNYFASYSTPTIFEIWMDKITDNTWDELLEIRKNADIKLPEDWRLLELIGNYPTHKYFDIKSTPSTENATDVVKLSFKEAVKELEKRKAEGKENRWGKYKPMHIYHLTRLPALSAMSLSVDGCGDALNANTMTSGPSWRMIVELNEKIKAYGVYPGGQSGNPNSKHYKDMLETWRKGEYFELSFVKNKAELDTKKSQYIAFLPK